MAYNVSNRSVNLQGSLNVVFGDFIMNGTGAELVTGLKSMIYFNLSDESPIGAPSPQVIYNSNDGVANSKPGSMWVSGPNAKARFMAIGI